MICPNCKKNTPSLIDYCEHCKADLKEFQEKRDFNLQIKGSRIFWLYIIFDVFLLATGAMLFFGLSSIIADQFFELGSSGITAIFFSGAGIVLTTAVLAAIALIIFEMRWQDIFNDHIAWHKGFSRIKKRQRNIRRKRRISKKRQQLSNQES